MNEHEALLNYLARATKTCAVRGIEAGQRPALEMTLLLDLGQKSPLLERWLEMAFAKVSGE
jgi:hypothetical protein